MPTQTLLAGHYIHFSFHFQKKFLGVNVIRYDVESEYPIETMVMDGSSFRNWQNGQTVSVYAHNIGVKHKQDFAVPFNGDWYLVINNTGQPTAIHYEVY